MKQDEIDDNKSSDEKEGRIELSIPWGELKPNVMGAGIPFNIWLLDVLSGIQEKISRSPRRLMRM